MEGGEDSGSEGSDLWKLRLRLRRVVGGVGLGGASVGVPQLLRNIIYTGTFSPDLLQSLLIPPLDTTSAFGQTHFTLWIAVSNTPSLSRGPFANNR